MSHGADNLPTQSFSGTSDQATSPFTVSSGLAVFKATYNGSDNFSVELIDSNGQLKDVLFNQIGSYSGSTGNGLDAGAYVLKVTASGPWTITVDQPRRTTGDLIPKSYAGTSEALVGPFQASGGSTRMQFHFTGRANFAVEVVNNTGGLVDVAANQIGNYDGSTLVQTHTGSLYWLKVTGDGSWTIGLS